MDKVALFFTGMPGSGKSTAAEILNDYGFKTFELRWIVEREMNKNNINIDTKSIRDFSKSIREKYGNAAVVLIGRDMIIDFASNNNRIAFGGLRSFDEYSEIKSLLKDFRSLLIAIEADPEIRFKRSLSVNKIDKPRTLEEFLEREKAETNFGIIDAMKRADIHITNNYDSIEDFKKELIDRLRSNGVFID
ncbi:MAG: dephospho-CoA kinase [Candidatus Micrarchaeota archaeon]|nr:MAG: dephospho-CoA kinase [Candidatus Micrarchaeota archaeon]